MCNTMTKPVIPIMAHDIVQQVAGNALILVLDKDR